MNRQSYIISVLLCLFSLSCFSQLSINDKRVRLGLDIGFPNLVSINGEYISPLWNNRISFTGDLGYIPFNGSGSKINTLFYGLGSNIYLHPTGKGPYLGLAYGYLNFNSSELNDDPADFDVGFSTFNSKIGWLFGDELYFKVELGYSMIFYDLESVNAFLFEAYSVEITPEIDFLQLLNGRIGVGYRF
jgi:hypothetical protein